MSARDHAGEQAFAALKIEDLKNFLRRHIAPDGSLTIHPVKIERVPRRWRDRIAGEAGSRGLELHADGTATGAVVTRAA